MAVLAVLAIANLMPRADDGAVKEANPTGHDVASTTNGADIHFSTSEVDLGVVPLGKEVGYAFSYANVGNETLRIEDVQVRVLEGC